MMVDVSDCSLSHEDGRTLFGTDCYIPLSFRVIPKIRLSHSGSVNSGSVPGPRIKESDRPRDYVIVLDKVPTIALHLELWQLGQVKVRSFGLIFFKR